MYPVSDVSEPTTKRIGLLLYVLYVCVFWRGEAEHLAQETAEFFRTHRQQVAGGFFVLDKKDFESQSVKGENECLNTNTPKYWFQPNRSRKT
jgi:hypothetical protein